MCKTVGEKKLLIVTFWKFLPQDVCGKWYQCVQKCSDEFVGNGHRGKPQGLGRGYLLLHHRIIKFGKDLRDQVQLVTAPCMLSHVVKCCGLFGF